MNALPRLPLPAAACAAMAALAVTAFPCGVSAQTFDDEKPVPIEEEDLDEEPTAESLEESVETKRDFEFAQPGKTSTRTAFNTAGKPHRDYEARVVQGEMEVLLGPMPKSGKDPLLVKRARSKGKGLSYVHVLEYDEPTGKHILVFRDDILWYAMFPTRAGETKRAEVARRYGDSPKMSTSRRNIEGAEHSARVHWFPESGVGFVQLDGGERYSYKLVFEPKTKKR